jgi:spoIIIJ-associated protein
MDDKTKLDAYLENLGISDDAEASKPVIPTAPASSPITPAVSATPPRRDDERHDDERQAPARAESDAPRSPRLNASVDAIVEDFLSGMLMHLDPGYTVSAHTRGDSINAEVTGGDAGKIIGREGRTLAAIEFLANTVLAKEHGQGAPRVNVDAAGYRRRHEERLLEQARRIAARVRKSGEEIELDPMTAADRRIIHIALREDSFVSTESVGEGRERRIVIKSKG